MILLQHAGRPLTIGGFAALFDVPATREDGSTLVIRPGAFRSALKRGAALVRANWDHDMGFEWAAVATNTLWLWEDQTGLAFLATVRATPFAASLGRYIWEGTAGTSVLFTPGRSKKTAREEVIETASLDDICISATPLFQTACWLGHSALSNLPAYARNLRQKWNIGRCAYLRARAEPATSRLQARSIPKPPAHAYIATGSSGAWPPRTLRQTAPATQRSLRVNC